MSIIINLYGGPGLGKSTTAAALFSILKCPEIAKLYGIATDSSKSVELVQEAAKEKAWEGVKITQGMQSDLIQEQIKRIDRLLDKVDYIITDSPTFLSPMYESHYHGTTSCLKYATDFREYIKDNDHIEFNIMLSRHKAYEPKGRFETEEQATTLDKVIEKFLVGQDIAFCKVTSKDPYRIKDIYSLVQESLLWHQIL